MRKLSCVVLVLSTMPLLAAPATSARDPVNARKALDAASGQRCYFIRQANHLLQAPSDAPRFMPLASATQLSAAAAIPDCMLEQRAIKAVVR
jgi:hypothetical protein